MGLFDEFQGEEHLIHNKQGVLGGEGFDEFETITAKQIPGQNGAPSPGYVFTLHCLSCSYQQGVQIGWTELVDLSAGALPTDPDNGQRWTFNGGKASPPCNCQKCGKTLYVYMTPDEAQRYVRTGVQTGAVNEAGVIHRVQQVRQQLAAYQQQRR